MTFDTTRSHVPGLTCVPTLAAAAVASACLFSGAAAMAAQSGAAQSGAGGQQGQAQQAQQQAGSDPAEQSAGADKPVTKQLLDRYKLSTWLGKSVQNAKGEELGTVEELVMDDAGRVRYVVMQSELLAERKAGDLVAVPAGHFAYPAAPEHPLIFDVTPGQMQQAPAFGAAGMPDMGHPTVSSIVVAYWLPEGAGEQRASEQTDYDIDKYEPNRDIINLSQQQGALFEKLDDNGDDLISREEAQDHERLSERFGKIDSYGNKAITRSEFAAFEIKDVVSTGDQSSQNKGNESGKQPEMSQSQ
ncbi:hypothetical protein CKO31_09775 [Thiohalocapsa halophila]|uniref:PRC-barrel domain-containing protein n=1 Tax=Thiohalocapsa halophila TaxID=69359 RepID=A0ABS1CGK0_9GAMM|nr:PRC-barrel domain-containing protein [Thiohalocapsa halophila]MBK1631023.1 hypothetical protein [Thiohalocapsa halophila]